MKNRRRSPERSAGIRNGGIQPSPDDPLRHAPLREPYAARSGTPPSASGTAETVTRPRRPPRRPTGRRAR